MPFGKYLMKVVNVLAKWPQFLGASSASFTRHILCYSWHLVWLLSSRYQSCLHLAKDTSTLGHWSVCGSKKTRLLKLLSIKVQFGKSSMQIMRLRNDVRISYRSYLDELVQHCVTTEKVPAKYRSLKMAKASLGKWSIFNDCGGIAHEALDLCARG